MMKQLLILPALLCLPACGNTPGQLEAKAREAYAAHDYRTARLLLSQALEEEPANGALQLLKAKVLIAAGDGDGAGPVLQQLATRGTPSPELAELTAEAALLREAPDAAVAALGALKSVEASRLRAIAAIQQDDPAAAARHLDAAIAGGGNARAFSDYARLKLMQGDAAAAAELAARARALEPDGLDSLLLDGQLAVRRGDLGAALASYDRAAKLYPASLAAIEGKAAALGDLGRLDEMKRVVDSFAELAPDNERMVYLRARLAQSNKDWTAARKIVEAHKGRLAVRDPLRVIYGESLLRLGQPQQAIAQLGPVVRDRPANRQAALLLAEAQLAAGDAPAAITVLHPFADSPFARREELSLIVRAAKAANDPRLADYQQRLGSSPARALATDLADGDKAMRSGNWASAALAYDRILRATDGRNVLVLNNMAYAQTMLGDYAKADQFARQALELAPDNASVLDTAGWARFKLGKDPAGAIRLLRAAAEKAPGNPTIRAHLAEAGRGAGQAGSAR